jgi:hypothetical protein
VQNFRTIGQGVSVGWLPEKGMFLKESEVVLNTVLSANALHVIPLPGEILVSFWGLVWWGSGLSTSLPKGTSLRQNTHF